MNKKQKRIVRRNIRPKSWIGQIKFFLNSGWRKVFDNQLFDLSMCDQFDAAPVWQLRLSRYWDAFSTFSKQSNLFYAIGLLIFCIITQSVWRRYYPEDHSDLWVEFWGLIFDIFFILIVFSFFEHRRQCLQGIQNQQEIIDDYKRWDSPEAHFRIAGAVRRLNKLGIYALQLSGLRQTDFSFSTCQIGSIKGSIFYDGTWGGAAIR